VRVEAMAEALAEEMEVVATVAVWGVAMVVGARGT